MPSTLNRENARTTQKSGHVLSGGFGVLLFIVLLGAAGALAYVTLRRGISEEPQGQALTFVCSETNKPFEYTMKEGEDEPVLSPYSNKKTGYRAEACYWTRDGKRNEKPTWVILNSRLGKPGDTICPDCGRPVVGHNPAPGAEVPLAKEGNASPKPSRKPD